MRADRTQRPPDAPKLGRPPKPLDVAEAIRLWRSGASLSFIARKLGTSYRRLRKELPL